MKLMCRFKNLYLIICERTQYNSVREIYDYKEYMRKVNIYKAREIRINVGTLLFTRYNDHFYIARCGGDG